MQATSNSILCTKAQPATLLDDLLEILQCPTDQGRLASREAGSTDSGAERELVCETCGRAYPVHRGIPRFVPDDQYVGSFSYEWTVHRTTQLDDETRSLSEETFARKTGLTPDEVRGKRVLDVGCGMGRFADVVVKWGGTVVGVDLSLAVESAQRNLGASGCFQAIQASAFALPLRPGSFDLVYSLGVLHHTPDCKRAFLSVVPAVREGGIAVIWVYSSHTYPPNSLEEIRDGLYRSVTTKMNPRLLHLICRVLCAVRVPFRSVWHMLLPGFLFHAVPRLHPYDDYDWRVLDTFDWYSPKYQSKHSYPEIFEWFQEAGFRDIRPREFEVTVWGRK